MNDDNDRLGRLLKSLAEGGAPEEVRQRLAKREEDFRRQIRAHGVAAARPRLVRPLPLWQLVEGIGAIKRAYRLAAVAVVVAAVAAVIGWLAAGVWRSGQNGRGGAGRFVATTLPFPQLLAESMRKAEDVETLVVTATTTEEGRQQVTRSYYKSPHFRLAELPSNRLVLDDGRRHFVLDVEAKKVLSVEPSFSARGRTMAEMMGVQWYREQWEKNGRHKVTGPSPDTIDDTPCQRYDFETTMPARPQLGVPERTVTGSIWFSVETGLLLTLLNRSGSRTNRVACQYNVPIDDSLFAVPPWAEQVKLPRLRIVVRNGGGQPMSHAEVHFGRLGRFSVFTTDEQGEALLAFGTPAYRYPDSDLLTTGLWQDVVVESADGAEAAVYTFEGLELVFGKGLREVLYRREPNELTRIGEREFFEERAGMQVDYDPEQNLVALDLSVPPKGTVTGRLVNPDGAPIDDTSVTAWVSYHVRGKGATVAYGQIDARIPDDGSLSVQELYFNVEDDGTFGLLLPTNLPLRLNFQPLGPKFCPTSKEVTLNPGATVPLGDVVLPYAPQEGHEQQ